MYKQIVELIREIYKTEEFIPLHEPRFSQQEKDLVVECIESTFVSSVGKFVDQFERDIEQFTGAKHAIAVVNGTQALFVALQLAGVNADTEVITQAATFVATANAIHYHGAEPIFLDVDQDTLGLSPEALRQFLETETIQKDGTCWNRKTGKQIAACLPMHTFGHACRIDEISQLCEQYNLILVEDAAESLGSYFQGKHTGRFGRLGVFSFNGNKIITSGGGGMIICDDDALAKKAKHLTTTAKVAHPWEYIHDEVGYNFRMPNLNAALGVAQLSRLPEFLKNKRNLAAQYQEFFRDQAMCFLEEPENCCSNYWLNAIALKDKRERESFLKYCNEQGVMVRGLWTPMHQLPIYQHCQRDELIHTTSLCERVVNIPSSARQANATYDV
jgi:perosamine synthetase